MKRRSLLHFLEIFGFDAVKMREAIRGERHEHFNGLLVQIVAIYGKRGRGFAKCA